MPFSAFRPGRPPFVATGASSSPESLQALLSLTAKDLDELKDLDLRIKKHKQIDIRGVDEIVKTFITGFRRELNPLSLLAPLKSFHEYTFTPVTNVCILTMGQADTLGFAGQHLHQIGSRPCCTTWGSFLCPRRS